MYSMPSEVEVTMPSRVPKSRLRFVFFYFALPFPVYFRSVVICNKNKAKCHFVTAFRRPFRRFLFIQDEDGGSLKAKCLASIKTIVERNAKSATTTKTIPNGARRRK
jgi:hypothetical protein